MQSLRFLYRWYPGLWTSGTSLDLDNSSEYTNQHATTMYIPIGVVSKKAIAERNTAESEAVKMRSPAVKVVKLRNSEKHNNKDSLKHYLMKKLKRKENTAMATPSAA